MRVKWRLMMTMNGLRKAARVVVQPVGSPGVKMAVFFLRYSACTLAETGKPDKEAYDGYAFSVGESVAHSKFVLNTSLSRAGWTVLHVDHIVPVGSEQMTGAGDESKKLYRDALKEGVAFVIRPRADSQSGSSGDSGIVTSRSAEPGS